MSIHGAPDLDVELFRGQGFLRAFYEISPKTGMKFDHLDKDFFFFFFEITRGILNYVPVSVRLYMCMCVKRDGPKNRSR